MYLDANEELEEIDANVRHLPEVLAVRVQIYEDLEQYELMQAVAKRLVQHEPENVQWWVAWAKATRQVESLEAGKSILLEAVNKYPKAAIVHYNLACYECQLGDLEAVKKYLDVTFRLDPKYRIIALNHEDLMPMWLMLED